MIFTSSEKTFICTGTLLADRMDSKTPFFLTAHHCISTAAEASSLETTWFYESSACNSDTQSADTRSRSGGATLLEAYVNNDMTLLRLNEQPPAGVVYAGWFSDSLSGFPIRSASNIPRFIILLATGRRSALELMKVYTVVV